ncbi:aspartate aminotransferase family protein [Marivita sp. XM-24bin2]|jgi:4-aminobutyrate--pyruvate transaminase|uniref:aspartate aminotransferase family protein n=1 Tax=unclassified Marivita TaxID=2632480 RepID=UPI000D7AFA17|nr:aspartate aminotransferase family protein [Marivita sp. XM-24bin2]MCR9109351.1 aspartate aminotransferase family protein [Paracoccaceae bacterium]PWL35474.1 MAG: aspartate aminotransferase family protein [Marivita sp. XM-24bin2]
MDLRPNSDEARDIAYHFHSYTNARLHEENGPLIMDRGEGVYVFDTHGNKYIEGMSGLWSVAVGFNEQRLIDAATSQMQKLPYYHNFAHRSHGPAIDLAEKLISMAPVPMSKVFFTNSGSEANDTILKMIWYRSNSLGKPEKKKVISRIRGYHGVTIASASMTGLPYNHKSFDLPLDGILHTTCPHYWREGRDGESEEQFATRCAEDLDAMIQAEGPDTIAAFIAEPVMGAGGVVVPPKTYWEKVQAVLGKYDILLIADEVICGFGRTGKMFGCETFNIKPDIMTMSKQITSSYFPFSAFMMTEEVYSPIADESGRIGVLGHGYTGGAHPVGAAVALENLKIIEERDLVANAAERGAELQAGLRKFTDHPLVGEARGVGLIAALEIVAPEGRADEFAPGKFGAGLNAHFLKNGLISRNMMDAMAFCPPMIIEAPQVRDILSAVEQSLDGFASELAG